MKFQIVMLPKTIQTCASKWLLKTLIWKWYLEEIWFKNLYFSNDFYSPYAFHEKNNILFVEFYQFVQ